MNAHRLTPLGKALRKLRIDRGEKMIDMSTKLGVSTAFLSAIEVGRKAPTIGLAQKIGQLYGLDGPSMQTLIEAENASRKSFTLTPTSPDARQTVALLARHINHLTPEELEKIREIAKRGEKA